MLKQDTKYTPKNYYKLLYFMEKELIKLGLDKHEAKTYVILSQKGQSTAGDIIKKTKIHRMLIYSALEKLENKGLIHSLIKSGVTYYNFNSPDTLLNYLQKQKETAAKLEEQVKNLQKQTPIKDVKTRAEVFIGAKGMRDYLNRILKETSYGGTLYLVDNHPSSFYKKRKKIFENYNKKRLAKKIEKRSINVANNYHREELYPDQFKLNKRKYLASSSGYSIGITFGIFNNYIAFEIDVQNTHIILFNNPKLAQEFRNLFEILWNKGITIKK